MPAALQVARRHRTGWSPLQLPGLVAWYDASRIIGLSDGTAIAQWDDLTGLGHHLLQGTGSLQPLYKTGITHGLPAVLFDGSNDYLKAVFTLAQPCSVAVSFVYVTDPGSQRVVVDGNTGNSMVLDNNGSATSFRVWAGTGLTQTSIVKTTWGIGMGVFNGASSVNHFRGTEVTGNAGTATAGGITIGSQGSGSGSANIYVGELIAADVIWDAPMRAAIGTYMARWV